MTMISPVLRYGARMVLDPRRNRFLLFGGTDGTTFYRDVWQLSLSPGAGWAPIPILGPAPTGRTLAGVVYDPVADRLIVHGGRDAAQSYADVWELPLSSASGWREITPEIAGAAARYAHTAVLDSARNRLVVFGGANSTSVLNDTWALSLDAHTVWTRLQAGAPAPPPRYDHATAYDPVHERILIFGGYGCDNSCFLNDAWSLSLGSDVPWQALSPTTAAPVRAGCSGAYDVSRNRFCVYGGLNSSRGAVSDVYALPLDPPGDWVRLGPSGVGVPGRVDASVGAYPAGDRLLVWGSNSSSVTVNQAVISGTGVSWSNWYIPTEPSERWGATAVVDAKRNRMLLYGGRGAATLSSTWILELTGAPQWVLPTLTNPPGRYEHTAILDPIRNRMLMFGGFTGSLGSERNDLWALSLGDIPNWTQLTPDAPAGLPPPRRGHTAIYDPIRDRMIVCGGNAQNVAKSDVWALSLARNGTWQPLSPTGAFAARNSHSAIYDPVADRMIVFGGRNGNTFFADVRALSLGASSAWSDLAPTGSPPTARYAHAAIYDPLRGRMVVVGGQDNVHVEYLNDVWQLSLGATPAWTQLAPDEQAPEGRRNAAFAYDPNGDRMLVFGGWSGTSINDVFALGWDPSASYASASLVTPPRGAATGEVTIEIAETPFVSGMSVSLLASGLPMITAAALGAAGDPTRMQARFDLRGVAPGDYDVQLVYPDAHQTLLQKAFTVQADGEPSLWVHLQGRTGIRTARTSTYFVEYANDGPVDAVGVPLLITGIPADAIYTLTPAPIDPPPGPENEGVDWSQLSSAVPHDGALALPLVLSRIPAGACGHLTLTINWNHPVGDRFELEASIATAEYLATPPFLTTPSPTGRMRFETSSETADECAGLDGEFIADVLGAVNLEIPPIDCFNAVASAVAHKYYGIHALLEACDHNNVGQCLMQMQKLQIESFLGAAHASGDCRHWLERVEPGNWVAIARVWDAGMALYHGWQIIKCNFEGHSTISHLGVSVTGAHDPNDKVGPTGTGAARWISANAPLGYRIDFENVATANAAAAEVVITDALDPMRFDLRSFALGPITIGTRTVSPPHTMRQWSTDVDLRPATDMIVRINAGVDLGSGIASWSFLSIDPSTGLPSEDPVNGFLPPNVVSPEGEGSVSYSIGLKKPVADGQQTHNTASIVFDANEAIPTPDWTNTLDLGTPSSHVLPLAANSSGTGFVVQWAGSDGRSGIQDYSIFVSRDDGPYSLWRSAVTAVADTFVANDARVLKFYSIARDSANNVEPPKSRPDAGTSTSTGAPGPPAPPTTLAMSPPRPNPSLDGVVFSLAVPTTAVLRITVSDVAGRQLRTLVDGPLAPGVYTVTWDGSGQNGARQAAGLYFVRLVGPGTTMMRRVVMLR